MICKECRIEFGKNEKALWCRQYECPITKQRKPTPEQCRIYKIEREPRLERGEER